mmetsp:Transcript_42343/g.122953  ORF Transcript_42343/g.122953 Transcript_42343/m.122953 type:complete len:246 (+) Transcript_42343:106-843(+)
MALSPGSMPLPGPPSSKPPRPVGVPVLDSHKGGGVETGDALEPLVTEEEPPVPPLPTLLGGGLARLRRQQCCDEKPLPVEKPRRMEQPPSSAERPRPERAPSANAACGAAAPAAPEPSCVAASSAPPLGEPAAALPRPPLEGAGVAPPAKELAELGKGKAVIVHRVPQPAAGEMAAQSGEHEHEQVGERAECDPDDVLPLVEEFEEWHIEALPRKQHVVSSSDVGVVLEPEPLTPRVPPVICWCM